MLAPELWRPCFKNLCCIWWVGGICFLLDYTWLVPCVAEGPLCSQTGKTRREWKISGSETPRSISYQDNCHVPGCLQPLIFDLANLTWAKSPVWVRRLDLPNFSRGEPRFLLTFYYLKKKKGITGNDTSRQHAHLNEDSSIYNLSLWLQTAIDLTRFQGQWDTREDSWRAKCRRNDLCWLLKSLSKSQ